MIIFSIYSGPKSNLKSTSSIINFLLLGKGSYLQQVRGIKTAENKRYGNVQIRSLVLGTSGRSLIEMKNRSCLRSREESPFDLDSSGVMGSHGPRNGSREMSSKKKSTRKKESASISVAKVLFCFKKVSRLGNRTGFFNRQLLGTARWSAELEFTFYFIYNFHSTD